MLTYADTDEDIFKTKSFIAAVGSGLEAMPPRGCPNTGTLLTTTYSSAYRTKLTSVEAMPPRVCPNTHHTGTSRTTTYSSLIIMETRGTCHGDMVRGRLARTYDSREGDMSWCIIAYCYGIG